MLSADVVTSSAGLSSNKVVCSDATLDAVVWLYSVDVVCGTNSDVIITAVDASDCVELTYDADVTASLTPCRIRDVMSLPVKSSDVLMVVGSEVAPSVSRTVESVEKSSGNVVTSPLIVTALVTRMRPASVVNC